LPFKEYTTLVVKSIEDVVRCTTLSSLLEIAGWPKPGNVHRTRDFKDTRFEHFLAAVAAIQPNFFRFCERIKKDSRIQKKNLSYIQLGQFFKNAAKKMMEWQKGGNVILGHLLILAPLVAASIICLQENSLNIKDFKKVLNNIIKDTTVKDTIDLYEAINICNPGGLGKVERYDLTNENAIEEIQNDKITLQEIFNISQTYDLISSEYSTGYDIILNEGLPYYINVFNQTHDINTSTVHTFLYILSNHPDTLIIRKSGINKAREISQNASKILKIGGLTTKRGEKLLMEMDSALQNQEGKLNPGTTADLIAGIIFCALIFGLKF
jgi:triphosphoribosyl-dephospho-CoA synthase